MRLLVLGVILLLSFVVLAFSKRGEMVTVMYGEVQQCVVLGGGNSEQLSHATIKAEDDSYIIASLKKCRAGAPVNILVKRGALYFNTVYTAQAL